MIGPGARLCAVATSAIAAVTVWIALPVAGARKPHAPRAFESPSAHRVPRVGPRLARLRLGSEVAALRTARSRTYVAPDGTFRTRVFEARVNYRARTGGWRPIDNRLRRTGAGTLRNGGSDVRIALPARLGGAAFRAGRGRRGLAFQPAGSRAVAATVAGDRATYAGAFRDADLVYQAESDALAERIVIRRPDAPTTYRFRVRPAAGLVARRGAGRRSGIEFADARGRVAYRILPPFAYDAAGPARDPFGPVSMALRRSESSYLLTVKLDARWLGSPARRFPVTVDPTVTFRGAGSVDCWIASWVPTSSGCPAPYTEIAFNPSTKQTARGLLRFDTSAIPRDALVTEAKVGLDFTAGTATSIEARGATKPWTNAATWNSYDGTAPWASPGGDFGPVEDTATVGAGAGWAYWYVSALAQRWVSSPAANDGLLLNLYNEQQSPLVARYANSMEAADQSTWPYMDVSWVPQTGDLPGYTQLPTALTDRMGLKVNVANGNLEVTDDDLDIAGTGLDLHITRAFNDLVAGPGSAGVGSQLFDGPDLTATTSVRGNVTIQGPGGYHLVFRRRPDGTFANAGGLDAALALDASASPAQYVLTLNPEGDTYRLDPATGEVLSHADRNGDTISYTWSGGRLSQIRDTQGRIVAVAYGTDGYVSSLTDPTGRRVSYARDASGLLTSFTDAAGKVTRYGYDGAGNLVRITTPHGNVVEMSYDAGRRVTAVKQVTDAVADTGPTTAYAYSSASSPCRSVAVFKTVVTDPDGNRTTYCADAGDRVIEVIDAAGAETSTDYDALGDPVSTTYPGGATETRQYNGGDTTSDLTLDRLTAPSGNGPVTTAAYGDPRNPHRATAEVDSQGNTVSYAYDAYGNTLQVADTLASQNKMTLTYSATQPRVRTGASDPDGNVTTFGYDGKGNLTSVQPPAPRGAETFGYDALSRRTFHVDGLGQRTTTSYDALDRLLTTTYQDGSTISDSYDEDGRLTQEADSSYGTTSYTYDPRGLLTKAVLTLTGAGPHTTAQYSYDAAGNLASFADDGGTVSYSYDSLNQLVKVTEPDGAATTLSYDIDGNRTRIGYPNGVTVTQTYDAFDRLTQILARSAAGATLMSRTYAYLPDASGDSGPLVQTVTNEQGQATTYTYDALNRLTEAKTVDGAGAVVSDFRYTYDGAGNVTSWSPPAYAGQTTTATYNAADEIASFPVVGGAYDAAGNQCCSDAALRTIGGTLAPPSASFAFNVRDQLASISDARSCPGDVSTCPPPAVTTLGYAGRQGSELARSNGPAFGPTTYEQTQLGVSALVRGSTAHYVTRDSTGEPLGERIGSGRVYFLRDKLGSVVATTDGTGSVAQRVTYDPYGSILSAGTPPDLTWLGSPGPADPTSREYHFGHRDFDPSSHRWIEPDPVRHDTDLTEANPYVYAGDDPVNATDPDGQSRIGNGSPGCGKDEGCWLDACETTYPWQHHAKQQGICIKAVVTAFKGHWGGKPACKIASDAITYLLWTRKTWVDLFFRVLGVTIDNHC